MYQRKHMYRSSKWRHKLYAVCLAGVMCLTLICMAGVTDATPVAHADGIPGGNISDPVVRAVDIAKPAVVRIFTVVAAQLQVTFSNGQTVTFPRAPQNGANGYPLTLSGTGTFISANGDILTADHVVNPVQDDKAGLDQFLQQTAAQDVANYINQNLNPSQQATPDGVTQELASGQLQSTSEYQTPISAAYLSTDFSGPLSQSNLNDVPSSQFAEVDKIEAHSSFNNLDIAIIHVSGMDDMPMVQLGDSSAVQEQDTLTIIGFPGNGDVSDNPTDLLSSSINDVLVSSIKTTDNGSPLIQVGGNVEQGDSGGPALDSKGNVVGIVSFGTVTGGSTSFLRTSNSAASLIQQAGVNTTPSNLQKAWSQAFSDYASTAPGHWHKAMQEFQQIAANFPQFKAVNQFLQYATQQAQTEKTTASQSTPTTGNGTSSLTEDVGIGLGAALLLIIVIISGVAISRRRRPASPAVASGTMNGYNNGFAPPGYPAQNYGASLPQPGQQPLVSTPPPAMSYQQPPTPVQAAPVTMQQQGYQPPAMQPAYQPLQQLPNYQARPGSQSAISNGNGMVAFGAPSSTPPASLDSDRTIVARPGAASVPQWRTWPCGHTNRDDARFCGTCGEPTPPPIVRRVEQ